MSARYIFFAINVKQKKITEKMLQNCQVKSY